MAFSGVAALVSAVGAGTAVTVGMVAVAVAEVGMALTVVGAVTGNEDLMKIGGIMSLAGGVTGFISGAVEGAAGAAAGVGLEGAATDAFTEAGTSLAGDLATPGMNALESTMTPAEMMSGSGGSFGETAAQSLGGSAPTGIVQSAVAPVDVAPAATGVEGGDQFLSTKSPVGASGPADIATPAVADNTAVSTPAGSTASAGGPVQSNTWWDSIKGTWNSMGDKTQAALVKTGTGLLQGAAQGADRKEQNDIARARVNQTSYGSQVPVGIVRKAAAA